MNYELLTTLPKGTIMNYELLTTLPKGTNMNYELLMALFSDLKFLRHIKLC
jgi:hypothetical protein